MAKQYTELPVDKWNTRHFTDYMVAEHKRIFGVDYKAMGGWDRERGLLSHVIGTTKKPGTHDKVLIKKFIDACFADYVPNANYPGTNFGFSWTYRGNVLQRIQADSQRSANAVEAVRASDNDKIDELKGWI